MSSSVHECLFGTGLVVDCSLCTLVQTNTALLCGQFANTDCSILQNISAHHARVGIRVLCAFYLSPCFCHHVFRPPLVSLGLSQLDLGIQLDLSHHVKIPQLRPSHLQFPGQHPFSRVQTGLIQHKVNSTKPHIVLHVPGARFASRPRAQTEDT